MTSPWEIFPCSGQRSPTLPSMPAAATRVTAVHEDDALALLERLGVAEAYQSGALTCSACGSELREAGLGAAKRVDGEITFACARLDCLEEFHSG